MLLCSRLIKREVIIVQISESQRELLYIFDQFAQRLVAAAFNDEVMELLIKLYDMFLIISFLDASFATKPSISSLTSNTSSMSLIEMFAT